MKRVLLNFVDCLEFNFQRFISGIVYTGIGVGIGFLIWCG